MLLYQIALTLIPGVGDITAKKLIAYCGSAEAIFKEKKKILEKIPGIQNKLIKLFSDVEIFHRAEKEIEFIQKYKIQTLFFLNDDYPERLKQCVDSPILLYYKGNAPFNVKKVIAIIGTRKISEYGKENCENIVRDLSASDILVVSGLAYGVDTCAHKSALDFGLKTIGVLGHGLDKIYPALNRQLASKITLNGGLITEFITETRPDRENFPKRNRIIAGMADAILVVEAAKRGGALITADIANSYNRDVFALPGRVNDEYSQGCNNLIKANKAALVTNADDILYMMGWEQKIQKNQAVQKKLMLTFSPEEDKIIEILRQNENTGIDEIEVKSEIPISLLAKFLLNLEFDGIIKSMPGKTYKLIV